MKPRTAFLEAIEQQEWLERVGQAVQDAVQTIYQAAGEGGLKVRDFIHGVWLGHPLHPLLTDIPIGAWSTAAVLDLAEMVSGEAAFGRGADLAVKIGVAGAGAAAVAGVTDYMHAGKKERKVGALHAVMNTAAIGLYASSLVFTGSKDRRARWGFALAGLAAAGLAGYLGGHLVFDLKLGVNHAPQENFPSRYTPVVALDELIDGKPVRCTHDGMDYVLVRRGRKVYALADRCAHLGGPLSEGELCSDNSIACPWHGSRFSLEDGEILQGPSTYPQPSLQVRVRSGLVELRKAPESIP